MEKIGLLLAFTTLPTSLFFSFAEITRGHLLLKYIFRLLGIAGVVLSIIYIVKLYQMI